MLGRVYIPNQCCKCPRRAAYILDDDTLYCEGHYAEKMKGIQFNDPTIQRSYDIVWVDAMVFDEGEG